MPEPWTQPAATDYKVALPVFEGPLDLLLHLIEQEELDITRVSLAQVTNQYLEYLTQISERDPDSLADFLVVAARLLLIKSRVLLPQKPPAPPAGEEEADGEDLVRQLIEYRRFKEAAHWLKALEAIGAQSYVRVASPPDLDRVVDLGDTTIQDLLAAVREVLEVAPPAPSVNGTVPPIRIRVADQMALIEQETEGGRTVRFRQLLQQAADRVEIVVTLLAVLEMIKQLRITVRQETLFGDVVIARREPPPAPESPRARESPRA